MRRKTKVLIVDDDLTMAEALSYRLQEWNLDTQTASDGEKGRRLAETQVIGAHPEIRLALVDVVLPDQSGIDILRQIVDRSPHPEVIMMSCDWKKELVKEVTHLGVTTCLRKPISPTGLDTALRVGLGQSPTANRWWRHAS